MSHAAHKDKSIDLIWDFYATGHRDLVRMGAMEYHGSLGGFANAFVPRHKSACACCMDERVPEQTSDGLTVRVPGSLIALPFEAALDFVRRIFVGCEGEKVLDITSHVHCGAGTLLYNQAHPGAKEVEARVIDLWVDHQTRAFVRKANAALKREGIRLEYVGQVDIQGDPRFHHAICAYYVMAMKGFSPSRVPGMLPGFVLSAGLYPEAPLAIADVQLAASIAFGGHGFNSRFSPERPFVVVGIADESSPETGVEAVRDTLHTGLSGLAPYKERRLTVDVFAPPHGLAS